MMFLIGFLYFVLLKRKMPVNVIINSSLTLSMLGQSKLFKGSHNHYFYLITCLYSFIDISFKHDIKVCQYARRSF